MFVSSPTPPAPFGRSLPNLLGGCTLTPCRVVLEGFIFGKVKVTGGQRFNGLGQQLWESTGMGTLPSNNNDDNQLPVVF